MTWTTAPPAAPPTALAPPAPALGRGRPTRQPRLTAECLGEAACTEHPCRANARPGQKAAPRADPVTATSSTACSAPCGRWPEGSMSRGCRARAETPLGAIALGTTPLRGRWPAVQVTPAAGTRLRPHEPLLVRTALLLCAPTLLVLLIPLSPPTAVAVLALLAFVLGYRALARHAAAAGA